LGKSTYQLSGGQIGKQEREVRALHEAESREGIYGNSILPLVQIGNLA
jgi:hypothetical protein